MMTILLRMCRVLAACLMVSGPSATALADEPLTMTYPGTPVGAWGRLSDELSTALRNDGINLDAFPESELGGAKLSLQALQDNVIDLAFIGGFRLAEEVRGFFVFSFPMLATDLGDARAFVAAVEPELARQAEDKGLKILAYTWLAGTFVTAGDCVLRPKDVQGAKVIDGPPFHQKFIEYLGGSSVALAVSEVYTAMQTGLTSTGLFSIPLIVGTDLRQATDCITDPSEAAVMLVPVVLIMNLERYQTLSAKDSDLLGKQAKALEGEADRMTMDMVGKAVQDYLDDGKSAEKIEGDALSAWREQADQFNQKLAEEYDVISIYEDIQQAKKARR